MKVSVFDRVRLAIEGEFLVGISLETARDVSRHADLWVVKTLLWKEQQRPFVGCLEVSEWNHTLSDEEVAAMISDKLIYELQQNILSGEKGIHKFGVKLSPPELVIEDV